MSVAGASASAGCDVVCTSAMGKGAAVAAAAAAAAVAVFVSAPPLTNPISATSASSPMAAITRRALGARRKAEPEPDELPVEPEPDSASAPMDSYRCIRQGERGTHCHSAQGDELEQEPQRTHWMHSNQPRSCMMRCVLPLDSARSLQRSEPLCHCAAQRFVHRSDGFGVSPKHRSMTTARRFEQTLNTSVEEEARIGDGGGESLV